MDNYIESPNKGVHNAEAGSATQTHIFEIVMKGNVVGLCSEWLNALWTHLPNLWLQRWFA